ncbi:hypothetical protein AAG570_001153 [Ranatra chinensis]|uniref:Uncharacterized protein n=1 Tax=Ranatra chinensis TaxID=642074 RepID=A0ABD0YMS0_9HEMI
MARRNMFYENKKQKTTEIAGEVIEALMQRAYQKTGVWTPYWLVFLTPKVKSALLPWDKPVLAIARKKCKLLRQVLVTSKDVKFKVSMLSELPPKVKVLDFDGELFFRGTESLMVLPHKDRNISWLPEAELILR